MREDITPIPTNKRIKDSLGLIWWIDAYGALINSSDMFGHRIILSARVMQIVKELLKNEK